MATRSPQGCRARAPPAARARTGEWGGGRRRGRRAALRAHAGHAHAGAASQLGVEAYLDSLKWNSDGLVVAMAQHVNTGAILMQAFADRTAVRKTLLEGKATFWSRSRQSLWTKGETSGNFIRVHEVFADCDADALIYLSTPDGPSCHTGAETCFFTPVAARSGPAEEDAGDDEDTEAVVETGPPQQALTTLYALEQTILERKAALGEASEGKPSWTARLLADPNLCCKKVREEADELCRTYEDGEGRQATASEMADVLYHSMVLCAHEGVAFEEVVEVLRGRFSQSGVEEKAARAPKA